MAIAFDAGTYAQAVTGSSLTFNHTVGTGNNRVLFVMGHDRSGTTSSVTGITANGRPLTKLTDVRTPSDRMISIWYLVSPQNGTNSIVVTSSISTGLRFSAVTYSGVGQITLSDGTNTNTGSSVASISTSITTTTDNCWMLMFSKDNDGTKTQSSSTGDTMRLSADAGGHAISDTAAAITPAGSNTMTHTWTGNVNVAAVAVAMTPYSTGISLDQTSSATLGASPRTGSHTTSGDDRVLIVGTRGALAYASGVTYNGVSMTRIADIQPAVGEYFLSLFYLIAPATGSNTISASVSSGNIGWWAVSITGADQTSQPDNSTINSVTTGTSLTTSLTTNTDNAWIFGQASSSSNTLTRGTNTYFLFTQLNNTCLFMRNGPLSPAGSYSVTTTAGSGKHAHVVASFDIPSVAATRRIFVVS